MGMDLKLVNFAEVGKKGCFVYCYLRAKDHTPYYVGIAKRADRVTANHTVNIPPDRRNIRILRSGLTHKEAQRWEQFYIAHYGRKDNGTGILRNQTDGGETGGLGRIWTEEQRRRLSEIRTGREMSSESRAKLSASKKGQFSPEQHEALTDARKRKSIEVAKKIGVDVDAYLALSAEKKRLVVDRYKLGTWKSEDLLIDLDFEDRYERAGLKQRIRAAEQYGLNVDFYLSLNAKQRLKIQQRYCEGMRGERLGQHLDLDMRTAMSLERYEVSLEIWNSLSAREKGIVRSRYNRGARGAELFVGISPQGI